MLLYLLGGREFAYVYAALRRWGERIGASPEATVNLPLRTHHAEDSEIQEIVQAWETFGVFQNLLMDSMGELTFLDVTSEVLQPLLNEVGIMTRTALKSPDTYPLIDLGTNHDQPVTPTGKDGHQLTGRAVLEGLARMNELMSLAALGVPLDAINEIIVAKQHGIYGETIGIAGRLLNVDSTSAWMMVAKLSDWALQAPVLPFLLRERETVPIMELLPAWRYIRLVSRFKQANFTLDDLLHREREVATNLFTGLGWADPWKVAKSILETDIPSPKAVLTRHYWENLQLGAELRLSNPAVLSFPNLGDQGHKLQALFNIFSDGIAQRVGSGISEDPQRWSLIASLITDASAHDLLLSENLAAAYQYAKWVSDFTGGEPKPGTLLGKALVDCVGNVAAKKVLEAIQWV